jgi:endonuclease-3
MTAPSRSAQLTKLHKVLKKYYAAVEPDPSRPVLEQLLYGCLLENASYQAAEEAYAALAHGMFDWNEVRVSTVRELAEAMPGLPDPCAAANRVKRVLQSVFEGTYAFDLEELRKLNLGQAAERLKHIDGVCPFAVAYVVQAALAGHSIPLEPGALAVLEVLDLVTPEEVAEATVRGMERAIAKSKGTEFGSLLHQFAADFVADPFSSQVRDIVGQIDPSAVARLPKRRGKKSGEPAPQGAAAGEKPPPAAEAPPAASKRPAEKEKTGGKAPPRKKKSSSAPDECPAGSGSGTSPEPADDAGAPEAAKKRGAAARQRPSAGSPGPTPDEPARRIADTAEKAGEKKRPSATGTGNDRPDDAGAKTDAVDLSKRKPR